MKNLPIFVAILTVVSGSKYSGPINQAGLALIKKFEGFYPNFYMDPIGIRTIGYGHACHVWNCSVPLNGKYNVPLTLDTGESLLMDDLKAPGRSEQCVNTYVTYADLNVNQYSALVSFTFNLGCATLQKSTLLTKLNYGDLRGAAEEFSKWVHYGDVVLRGQEVTGVPRIIGMIRRRAAERNLFCTGRTCFSSGSGGSSCEAVTTAGININTAPSKMVAGNNYRLMALLSFLSLCNILDKYRTGSHSEELTRVKKIKIRL